MIQKIRSFFEAVFLPESYSSGLEKYIVSRNPQSIEDIEYWTRQYDRNLIKSY